MVKKQSTKRLSGYKLQMRNAPGYDPAQLPISRGTLAETILTKYHHNYFNIKQIHFIAIN